MADDEAAKEEARILASLKGASEKATKNAFATKKPLPGSGAPAPPVGGGGGGGRDSYHGTSSGVAHPPPVKTSSGQMPAWKQQQLDKERREQEKLAEEERKRKEKIQNMPAGGVVEESVVSLGGPPQYHNIQTETQQEQVGVSGGDIDSSSVAKEVDIDEQMRIEEERLLSKTNNTAPLPPRTSGVISESFTTNLSLGKKMKVIWIDRRTEKPLQSFDWYCNQDRLPLKAIMHEWKIRNVYWADLDQQIGVMPDGFSDMTFEGISVIKIFADRI